MGLTNWLSSFHTSAARKEIQQILQLMKSRGLFDDDPVKSAQAVENFSASRFSKVSTNNMSSEILAISWLVVFVKEARVSREYLLPLANAGLSLMHVAIAPNFKLSSREQGIIERALFEFQAFIDATPINLNLSARKPLREVAHINESSSMDCIMAEYNYLNQRYGMGGWQRVSQASIEEEGRFYDKFTITVAKGRETVIWFDLTESRARWTIEGNVETLNDFREMASEEQSIDDQSPRDRDRAMTELIKRMKN
ncbi:MAG: hypothetical protein WBC18_14985 [Ottowia sp.]|uniref:hypothetical protein n=1 Tax=Ottowia sp. TaxID=1898956 RepID=UPI003C73F890